MIRKFRPSPVWALLFGIALSAFGPVFVRLTGTGPAAAGFWRVALALPPLILFALLHNSAEGGFRPNRAAIAAGILFAADLLMWHAAIRLTTLANATVLANFAPILIVLSSWLLLRQPPARGTGPAFLLAFSGTMLLVFGGGEMGESSNIGDALALAAAWCYAGYLLVIKVGRLQSSAASLMLWSNVVAAPILLSGAMLMREDLVPETALQWLSCLALGVIHFLGQGAITWSLLNLQVGTLAIGLFVYPAIAACLGWLIFSEELAPVQIIGIAASLVGVALVQKLRKPPSASQAENASSSTQR